MTHVQEAMIALAFIMALAGLGIIFFSFILSMTKSRSALCYSSHIFGGIILMFIAFMIFLGIK